MDSRERSEMLEDFFLGLLLPAVSSRMSCILQYCHETVGYHMVVATDAQVNRWIECTHEVSNKSMRNEQDHTLPVQPTTIGSNVVR
jgi:hypothetical protein